jgi:hypothetical protein
MNYLQCPENNTIARHNVIQNGLTQRSAADQHQDLKARDLLPTLWGKLELSTITTQRPDPREAFEHGNSHSIQVA